MIYRFAPATSAYGRGYHPWPEKYTEGMTDAQRAVMEAPYHPRMNRPYIGPDGVRERSKSNKTAMRLNRARGQAPRLSSGLMRVHTALMTTPRADIFF